MTAPADEDTSDDGLRRLYRALPLDLLSIRIARLSAERDALDRKLRVGIEVMQARMADLERRSDR